MKSTTRQNFTSPGRIHRLLARVASSPLIVGLALLLASPALGQKIFWSDDTWQGIISADLDGTNIGAPVPGIDGPILMAFDATKDLDRNK